MRLKITIENYEEIMFRLVEDDFDEPTKKDLLQQIEIDGLLKFEWESWQKAKFDDPLENYSDESRFLLDKILLIAEPSHSQKSRIIYYWAAAASIVVLIASLFFVTTDFTSKPKQEIATQASKSVIPVKKVILPVQNQTASTVISNLKQPQNRQIENHVRLFVSDSNAFVSTENTLAENHPAIDSIPAVAELVKITEKKPRYIITIETSPIDNNTQQNNFLAQHRKVKIGKVLTGTRLFLLRKGDGEPDKVIIMGDENNYLCINLNYTEK